MDEKSLELLEFPQVREQLAGYTSFAAGRELALKVVPLTDYDEITLLLRQCAEARRLLATDHSFTIGDVYDIRETVKLASIGKVLDAPDLIDIQITLGSLYYLRRKLSNVAGDFPLLWDIAEGLVELRDLENDISNCFTADGEIRDSASAKLEGIRQQARSVRKQLQDQLQGIINSPRWHKVIQDPLVTEREGRFVIPVKVEYRREVKGIVHDISNTGATAFVEPWSTIEHGNTLRELEIEEKYEVERILRSLSERVGYYRDEIMRSLDLVAELDLITAKAKYGRRLNAVEPEILDPEEGGKNHRVLKLFEARHPLLAVKAVPLSIEMGKDFRILIITGPNTGGKTVALKTIGLLSLMALSGLPIPASPESVVPLFDNVFADIGDEQSIAQTLSTFSWHVTNLVRIVNQITDRSMILLDELGTSTDPTEGAALARSILQYFLDHGAMAVATTHFSELKAYAHTTPGLQNASLDFDPVNLTPTYHLTIGLPGGSNALATASRLGLSPEIVDVARDMLSQGSRELEKLLADIMAEKQTVQNLRYELELEKAAIDKRSLDLENEKQKLRSEEKHILSTVRDQVVSETADLFRDIRQATAELRKERSQEKIEQARKVLAAAQEKLKSKIFTPVNVEQVEADKIQTGDHVWLKEANIGAIVLAVFADNRQVELQVGRARLKVGIDSIEKMDRPLRQISEQTYTIERSVEKKKVSLELDLRGKRADEVKDLVDSYLNDAAVANLPWVRIINGHGTGVIKQVLREMLAVHPLVKSYRPGERTEGGDGVTIANLK